MHNSDDIQLEDFDSDIELEIVDEKKMTPRDFRKREKRLMESRDDWKAKNQKRAAENKDLRENLGDAKKGRDAWRKKYQDSKKKSEQLETLIKETKKQVEQVKQEKEECLERIVELQKELEVEKKKRRNNQS